MLLFRKNKKKPTTTVHTKVDLDHLPRHVAIIMDGNGRWAKKRGMPRTAGHAAGAETFRTIATYCKDIGLDYLTVYAFSTENWKRPQEEVGAIMGLLRKYLHEAIEEMARDHIKLQFFGDLTSLDPELYQLCQETRKISEGYDGFQVNVCLNYGGRDEIVRAARKFAAGLRGREGQAGGADGRAVRWRPVLRRHPRPGAHHPPQRGRSGRPTSCSGSPPTLNTTLPTCSGRISLPMSF